MVCFDRVDLVSESDFRWDPDDFDFDFGSLLVVEDDFPVDLFPAGLPISSSFFKFFSVRRGRFDGLSVLFSMNPPGPRFRVLGVWVCGRPSVSYIYWYTCLNTTNDN